MKKYTGVLKRVSEIESKNGIYYAKTDGILYKSLNAIFIMAVVWGLAMSLMYILSIGFRYIGTDDMEYVLKPFITVCICTIVLIAGVVLLLSNKHITAGIISFLSCVVKIPVFAVIMKDEFGFLGLKTTFYWRHAVPLLISALIIIWMTVIAVRAKIKTERLYKSIMDNLFNKFKLESENPDDITEEQWLEFIEGYSPENHKKQFKAN